jgi:hypothetical protein
MEEGLTKQFLGNQAEYWRKRLYTHTSEKAILQDKDLNPFDSPYRLSIIRTMAKKNIMYCFMKFLFFHRG